jgi:hypothetical protein
VNHFLPWTSNKYIFVCVVCARARVCPGTWACACVYVHVALLIHHATRMRHIVALFVATLAPPYFFENYIINGTIFRKM